MGAANFGKYRLIAELGHGGMADVFLAVQKTAPGPQPRELTVIKRLRQNLVEEPEFVDMLVDEGKLAARLMHPNIVRTNEIGSFDGTYFIEMEYLDGQPLHRIQNRAAQRAKEGKPSLILPEHQLVVIMDACAGLHHAHGLTGDDGKPLSIVHRDVTPQNIFVQYDGHVKVVDFGIAKAAGRASETRQGVVKGKIRYMAPEQALGEKIDRRADVFSVGIMLWEVITKKRLWFGVEDLDILRSLAEGSYPASPRTVDPAIPAELDAICQKALARDRDVRYGSTDELRDHLEHYLASSGRLLEARRELAVAVSELFADKRTEIKTVIDRQLAALDRPSVVPEAVVPIPADSVPSASQLSQQIAAQLGAQIGMPASDSEAFPAPPSTPQPLGSFPPISSNPPPMISHGPSAPSASARPGTVSGPPAPVPVAQRALEASAQASGVDAFVADLHRRRRNTVASALAVVAILVALGFGAWTLTEDPGSGAANPVANAEITLRLKAAPANAKISIDDGPLAAAPVTLQVAKDARDHHVHFEAEGFVPRTEVVPFRDDLAMFIALAPVDSTTAPGTTTATPGPDAGAK